MSPATSQTRELAARDSDGIHVLLLWHPRENTVTVSVEDARSESASSSRSRPTAPSMPSTTPSPMPPNEGRSRPAERRTAMFRTNHRSHVASNLAARMGRWSAAHWKTATFGWLAFVVVAFALGGMVGTEEHRPERARAGRVRPHGQDPRRRASSSPPARTS